MTSTTDILRLLFTAEDRASGAVARLRGELKGLQADIGPVGRTLATALVPLAAGFSLAGMSAWLRSTVEGIDSLNDLADATGDSVENLSALEDIALRTGTSMDTASSAVVKLNQALLEGSRDPDSLAGRAIKNLGLDVKALMALSPVERLQAVGRALNSFGGENKLEYNLALLGKSVAELAPLLKDLGETQALQAKLTTKQAEEAEKLRKEWFALQKDTLDLSRALAGPMVSAINETIEKFRQGAREGKGFFETLRGEQLKMLGLGPQVQSLDQMNDRLRELNSLLDSPRRLGLAIGQAPKLEAERKELAAQIASATAMKRALDSINDPANYGNEGRRTRVLPPLGPDPKKPKATTARSFDESTGMSESLAAALKLLDATDTAKIAALNAQLDQLFTLRASGLGPDSRVDEAIKRLRDELEQLDPAAKRARDAKAAIDELLGIGPDSSFSRTLDQMQELQRRLDAGAISTDAYIAALKRLEGDWSKTMDDVGAKGKEVGEEIALVFSSAAGQAITQWQGFGHLLEGIAADMAQLALREIAIKPLNSWLTDTLKGFSFASLFGSANGNAFDSRGVIPFAAGGIIDSPTLFRFASGTGLMGEAGPEAIMPLRRGSDGKLGVAGGGGGITVNQVINAGAGVSRNELIAAMQVAKRETIASIADAQRRSYAS